MRNSLVPSFIAYFGCYSAWLNCQICDVNSTYIRRVPQLTAQCPHFLAEVYAPSCVHGHSNDPTCSVTYITAALYAIHLTAIDDVAETFTFGGSLTFQWDATCPGYDLPRGEEFYVDENEIWKPHMNHINTVNNFGMGDGFTSRMYAKSNGNESVHFQWQRFGVFYSTCEMDYALFPFDSQQCHIQIGTQENMAAVRLSENVGLKIYDEFVSAGTDWALTGTDISSSVMDIDGNRSTVSFHLTFKRNPQFFVNNLMVPTIMLSSLVMPGFFIPPNMADRSVYSITILLALTFHQSDILSHVPAKPQHIFLSDHTDYLTWFTWASTIYCLTSCAYSRGWKQWFEVHVTFRQKHDIMTRARVVDSIMFSIAMVVFIGINGWALSVAMKVK